MTSYGGQALKVGSQDGGSSVATSSGKKRVDKLKVTSCHPINNGDSLTPKQAMMIAAMQQKGASKMSMNTGNSSSKGSTHSKVPSSSQRNEYLSTQQTKHQFVNAGHHQATTRSHPNKKEE